MQTLVFLHAFPMSSKMWDSQIEKFSGKFKCAAPDLPGFGENPLSEMPFTFEAYADSVLNFLKKEKIEKAIFCGLSMGGYLALRLYERSPEIFAGLVLCDTKAAGDTNEGKLKRWDSIQLLKKSREEFIAAQWKALVSEKSQKNENLKQRFAAVIEKNKSEAIAEGLVALATRNDSTSTLSKISVPTMIIVGEEDKVTPVSESEVMNKAIAKSTLRKIPGAGHLSNLEEPDKFNYCMSEFLESISNASA